MTSSFGNVIGTPRDQLPDISKTNYLKTDADMSEAVNAEIDRSKEDTKRFYDQMVEIEKARATQFMDNLQALAQFSTKFKTALEVKKKADLVRELNEEALGALDEAQGNIVRDAENKFDFENAKFKNKLFKDAKYDKNAKNFLFNIDQETPQDVTQKQLLKDLKPSFGARKTWLLENGFNDEVDSEAAVELHNYADDLLITRIVLQAEAFGIDPNSRQFRKFFRDKVYPELKSRRENNLLEWERGVVRNWDKRRNERVDEKIKDVLGSLTDPNVDGTGGVQPDIDLLVKTIKEEKNFDKDIDALNYLFSRSATFVQSLDTLTPRHLQYLRDVYQFERADGGGKTTYANSNFKGKEANLRLLTRAETVFNGDPDADVKAAEIAFDEKIEALKLQYDGNPPSTEVYKLMAEQRDNQVLKNEPFRPELQNLMTRTTTTGASFGEYGDAGQSKSPYNTARGDLETAVKIDLGAEVGKESLTKIPYAQTLEIQAAMGDLRYRAEELVKKVPSKTIEEAIEDVLPTVQKNLLAGGYKDFYKAQINTQAIDIQNDRTSLSNDQSLISNEQYNSVHEKSALQQLKRYLMSGGPRPTYFDEVLKGVKITQADGTLLNGLEYGIERLAATGGLDEKTGLLNYKKNYNLTSDEINSINYKSSPTKTYNFISGNQEGAEKLLNGFAKERQMKRRKFFGGTETFTQSQEESDNYFYNPNTTSPLMAKMRGLTNRTIGQVYSLAKAGYTDFGRYGFTSEEIITAVESGAFEGMGKAKFTEDNQSYMVLSLIRNRANRSNSINGAQTEAKDWHRLTNLTLEEQEAVLQIFPNLRGMKNNQFQNLQADVAEIIITEAEKLRNEKATKKKAEEEARRLKAEQTFNPKTLYN